MRADHLSGTLQQILCHLVLLTPFGHPWQWLFGSAGNSGTEARIEADARQSLAHWEPASRNAPHTGDGPCHKPSSRKTVSGYFQTRLPALLANRRSLRL